MTTREAIASKNRTDKKSIKQKPIKQISKPLTVQLYIQVRQSAKKRLYQAISRVMQIRVRLN